MDNLRLGRLYLAISSFLGLAAQQVVVDDVGPGLAAQHDRGVHARDVHVIAATQRPTRDLINGQIAVNIDARVALRCPTAQDSRNIIGVSGAENLPRYGSCIYRNPDGITRYTVPRIPPEEIQAAVEWLMERESSRSASKQIIDDTTGMARPDARMGTTLWRGADLRDLDKPRWWQFIQRRLHK